ncbi:MAG: hypothetical protein PHS80_00055 [Methanothrix sp.]|nr:hypothetical protein [Methanothrix sp.]
MSEKKLGRPKIPYDPLYHDVEAERYASQGLINMEMAKGLGISSDTFYTWLKEHDTFSEAVKRGKAIADQKVVESLYKRATGFTFTETKHVDDGNSVRIESSIKCIPPDTTACIYWTKNRLMKEWRDKVETEVSGNIRVVSAKELSDDELARIAAGDK